MYCQREMTKDASLSDVVTAADSHDPAQGLRAVVVLRRLAERLEVTHVTRARLAGWTWEEIGDALGVSRQAVHKKHRQVP
jgi:DNA-directed RNA polymerase specialized sigma24 family protein